MSITSWLTLTAIYLWFVAKTHQIAWKSKQYNRLEINERNDEL
jgi:hypothetical protein